MDITIIIHTLSAQLSLFFYTRIATSFLFLKLSQKVSLIARPEMEKEGVNLSELSSDLIIIETRAADRSPGFNVYLKTFSLPSQHLSRGH